jgi:uncharacterized protein (DUF1499 family)
MQSKNDLSTNSIFSFLYKFRVAFGYYAVMLAPIYGIGLPFFGSITDFSTLTNRVSKNEYIVAPEGFTPKARIDEEASIYSVPPAVLKNEINKVILKQPRTQFIAEDPATNRVEYVQRSLIFRFPDVITFQIIPINEKQTTLAVHSYSVYGAGDLGVNGNRVRDWIKQLDDDILDLKL